jgi:predicted P-loop ATPase
VENADTFGDARKADFNRIKADISTDSFVGRDAYGRMEDMRRVNYTYVIWYTGNEVKVLRDPTGNRRFIIVYSEGPTDEDWLRLNGDQLLAQAHKEMEKLRSDYLDGMREKGLKEEYLKYLELPRDM